MTKDLNMQSAREYFATSLNMDKDLKGDKRILYLFALEALDRIKPMMPIAWTDGFHCQVCNSVVSTNQNYCDQCGQALDWKSVYGETK